MLLQTTENPFKSPNDRLFDADRVESGLPLEGCFAVTISGLEAYKLITGNNLDKFRWPFKPLEKGTLSSTWDRCEDGSLLRKYT